ncbi:hypothetical protein P256_01793 [Acinetobacter nectaris CIP 110549]|uniref:4-oxalocrotonate tautomerase domain-containing protein n=1 Tax=Acinetobacter nectaris CIP 110549 TaxID=1392540 RepID=V2TLG7_9GAMM|nr:tautomerase family protein [Acinetobacter nectaris]ESK38262.1 hypothetical protein P256_01793 [Acinetobacter nectaris CIP 110549]
MSQIKIYGLIDTINKYRETLSSAIHQSLVESLNYPNEKIFQRFIKFEPEDFIFPKDRSKNYLIIEISMFEGRSNFAKKQLIQSLFKKIEMDCHISPQDIEITIFETPLENWGIRGKVATELTLHYKVEV